MNAITPTPCPTIRARIHENAGKRVNRSVRGPRWPEIFAETFQNGRRAGATRLHVIVRPNDDAQAGEPGCTITVSDDGEGIADPAVLLSFGENGWSDELVRSARMPPGSASPASRAGDAPFPPARARPTAGPSRDGASPWHRNTSWARPRPKSSRTSPLLSRTARRSPFPASEGLSAIRNAAASAARHYPLPVLYPRHREIRPKRSRCRAAHSSTPPSMQRSGGASPSACSGTGAPASATPTSISTA